jgi:hypothetical protein
MNDFYDELAPLYHLIFEDWDVSIERQGSDLAAIIRAEWPGHRTVLDVSCGIGTQARAMRSRLYAIGTGKLLALMRAAGFENVRRLDDVFYQPVLVGTKPS